MISNRVMSSKAIFSSRVDYEPKYLIILVVLGSLARFSTPSILGATNFSTPGQLLEIKFERSGLSTTNTWEMPNMAMSSGSIYLSPFLYSETRGHCRMTPEAKLLI